MAVETITTEKDLVESIGLCYFRIPVADTKLPNSNEVDLFIQFVKSLPLNTWLHFHCKMGDGRTNTFLMMYRMIRQADQYPFEGFLNILTLEKERPQKFQFFKSFYQYCKENRDSEITYSEFLFKERD